MQKTEMKGVTQTNRVPALATQSVPFFKGPSRRSIDKESYECE